MIIRFQAANDEESVAYNSFYSYLSTRKRYGVVNNFSKKIKDFYILPLAATSPVPIVLMPFDGPGKSILFFSIEKGIFFKFSFK